MGSTTQSKFDIGTGRAPNRWRPLSSPCLDLVQPGDALFGNRLNATQAVSNLSNDAVTHVAIVAPLDGDTETAEYGPKGPLSRKVRDFVERYRTVGIARPAMCDACRAALAKFAAAELAAGTATYSWLACTLIQGSALVRSWMPALAEAPIINGTAALGSTYAARRPQATTCSGFVESCLSSPTIPCGVVSSWPRKGRVAAYRRLPRFEDLPESDHPATTVDPATVQILTSPNDLWVADFWSMRAVFSDVDDIGAITTSTPPRLHCRSVA